MDAVRGVLVVVLKLLLWLPSLVTFLFAVFLLTTNEPVPGLALTLAGILIFPRLSSLIPAIKKFKASIILRICFFFILWMVSLSTTSGKYRSSSTASLNRATPSPIVVNKATPAARVVVKTPEPSPTVEPQALAARKRINDLTHLYCETRKNDTRSYLLFKMVDGPNGEAEIQVAGAKQGKYLTTLDCATILVAAAFDMEPSYDEIIAKRSFTRGMSYHSIVISLGVPENMADHSEDSWLGPKETQTLVYSDGRHVLTLYFESNILAKWTEDY